MIVIFNTNGSIYDAEMADYVQQGSNGANRLQVAYVDSARSGLSAYLIAERPNGTSITLPAHKASFDCNGERYQGWEVTITGSFTLYAGVVHCTLNIVDEDDNILANYPFDVTVNATGNPINADWDEQINVAQYNAFMAMLSGKATINRVESKDELPIPGQRSVLWLVGTDKYDAYAWDPESEEYRTILNGIYVVGNIATDDISGLPDGQLIYDETTSAYYEKTDVSPYYAKALGGAGVLGAPHILCRSGDSARTIAELHTIYGDSKYIVLRYLDKDYLYFSKKVGSTYTCVAFDTEEQRFYKASGLSGSALPSTMLIPANKIEIASKAFLVSNYVPYGGANDDVDLGEHKISAKQLNLPQGKLRTDSVDDYATLLDGQFVYDNDYTNQKEDERAISSVKYVLENHLQLTSSGGGTLNDDEYAYASKPNAVIIDKDGIKTYRFIEDRGGVLYFACFNNNIDTQADGSTISFGWLLTVNKSTKAYLEQEIGISVYPKDQAKDKFATNFTASLDNTTYVLTFTLKNANGGTLATQTIDFPLESIVTSMNYYDTYTYDGTTYHNVLVIVLATTSVPTIVPVGSLISGLEHEALVDVSDISTPLTASQLALMEYPNAMIKYGYNVYLKAEDNGTYITLSVPYISLATTSGHEEATRKFIVVTKSSGAMALTSDTTSFYNKSQTDSLLDEKADASSVVTDSDIETLGGAVTRIRKGNTWNEVAKQVNMSTTPKVVQSVADLPADNDGYLYVVLDDGYLYSWDEENEEWAQRYQYTSDLLTITETEVGGDDYSYIEDKTNNNRPIQVESAKKDGNGDVIDETYARISDIETIDERLDSHDTEIAKLKKDVDYAMKYPLLYGTPTTDTEEEVGLTTSQLPATTLPKGLVNYVGGMSQKINQLIVDSNFDDITKWNIGYGINFTAQNNVATLIPTQQFSAIYNPNKTFYAGHKYLFSAVYTNENANWNTYAISGSSYVFQKQFFSVANNKTNLALILTAGTTATTRIAIQFDGTNTSNAKLTLEHFIVTDLTNIFGAGNEPTSTSDPRIPRLIALLKKYPEYNEGSIVSAEVTNLLSTDGTNESNYPIPAEVQALDGYGLGLSASLTNKVDFEDKVYGQKVARYTFSGNEACTKIAGTYPLFRVSINGVALKNSATIGIFSKKWSIASISASIQNEWVAEISDGYVFFQPPTSISTEEQLLSEIAGLQIVAELNTPAETDISEYLDRDFPNENIIDTYQGGEVEFENDNDIGVPYSLTYQYKVE